MKIPDNEKGTLVLISAPSGGGKNAVMRDLMKIFPDSTQLVTTTTRSKREGEADGVDYYFITRSEFESKLASGGFVEYNEYSGNLYGTTWEELDEKLGSFKVVFSQAEVHGKANLDKARIPHISIFLVPENNHILEARLRKRGGMKEEDIVERLRIAEEEIKASQDYDFRVVNEEGKFTETVDKIAKFLSGKI